MHAQLWTDFAWDGPVKKTLSHLPKRDELSLRRVLALPKASRTAATWTMRG